MTTVLLAKKESLKARKFNNFFNGNTDFGRPKSRGTHLQGILESLIRRVTFLSHVLTGAGSKDHACQDSGLSQIFKLIVSTSKKVLININVVVWRQVK